MDIIKDYISVDKFFLQYNVDKNSIMYNKGPIILYIKDIPIEIYYYDFGFGTSNTSLYITDVYIGVIYPDTIFENPRPAYPSEEFVKSTNNAAIQKFILKNIHLIDITSTNNHLSLSIKKEYFLDMAF